MGATQDKMIINKNGISMNFDARKGQNESMLFYTKAKRYATEGQEALTNLPENKIESSDKKEEWRKKLGLSSDMEINGVNRYSHLGEKLLRTTYNALGVKSTRTLQVCDGCAHSKANTRAVRNMTYTRASHPGEIFLWTQLVHSQRV